MGPHSTSPTVYTSNHVYIIPLCVCLFTMIPLLVIGIYGRERDSTNQLIPHNIHVSVRIILSLHVNVGRMQGGGFEGGIIW